MWLKVTPDQREENTIAALCRKRRVGSMVSFSPPDRFCSVREDVIPAKAGIQLKQIVMHRMHTIFEKSAKIECTLCISIFKQAGSQPALG
jgi:hypothetical protein